MLGDAGETVAEVAGRAALAAEDELIEELPVTRASVDHAWHLHGLRLKAGALRIDRARFVADLTDPNIGTSVRFIPIHPHPYYRQKYGYQPSDFPVALDACERMLSLRLSPKMTDHDVADVIEAVHDVVRRHRA
jgi:dTDP-4-amino-4,6-dideoxygalactose transaminase